MKKIFKKALYILILFISISLYRYNSSVIEVNTLVKGKLAASCEDYGFEIKSAASYLEKRNSQGIAIYGAGETFKQPSYNNYQAKDYRSTTIDSKMCGIKKVKIQLKDSISGAVLCETSLKPRNTYAGTTLAEDTRWVLTFGFGGEEANINIEGNYEVKVAATASKADGLACLQETTEWSSEISMLIDNKAPRYTQSVENSRVDDDGLHFYATFYDINLSMDKATVIVKKNYTELSETDFEVKNESGKIIVTIPEPDLFSKYEVKITMYDGIGNYREVPLSREANKLNENGEEVEGKTTVGTQKVSIKGDPTLNGNYEFNIGTASFDCSEISDIIDDFFNILFIVAPILTILMGTIEFVKPLFSSDADALQKAGSNMIKRSIALVLLMLLKVILLTIFNFFGINICL